MQEDFLQFVWQTRLYRPGLTTQDGDAVEVIDCGRRNTDAGPDFFNARVRIGNTTWAGNVEIHIHPSGWHRHGHQHDAAYDNVILHVVYDGDGRDPGAGRRVPVVALKDAIPPGALARYESLRRSDDAIPCSRLVHLADRMAVAKWLERMLVERLESKVSVIDALHAGNHGDWEETFYQFLARGFGFRLNAVPFELLARSVPLKCILKQKDSLVQVEALLFGTAGLLAGTFADEYPRRLQAEYRFLRNKYALAPLEGHLWKFARSRPANFPTVRIAQFAGLLQAHAHLLSEVIAARDNTQLESLFDTAPSAYWESHYRFDAASGHSQKRLGRPSVGSLLINTAAPFLFYYGKARGPERLADRALEILLALPAESNRVVRQWASLGIPASNAFESQALLELKNNYCQQKKCLRCGIGTHLLKPGGPREADAVAGAHPAFRSQPQPHAHHD